MTLTYKPRRRTTPKFYLIILLILCISILVLKYSGLSEKISEIFSRPLATSIYWEGFI